MGARHRLEGRRRQVLSRDGFKGRLMEGAYSLTLDNFSDFFYGPLKIVRVDTDPAFT